MWYFITARKLIHRVQLRENVNVRKGMLILRIQRLLLISYQLELPVVGQKVPLPDAMVSEGGEKEMGRMTQFSP